MAYLSKHSRDDGPTKFELSECETTIGRHPECSIVVNASAVSRYHAKVTRKPNGFLIEDSGSRNGTFLNGQLLTGAQFLKEGDRIRIGDVEFVFHSSVVPGFAGDEFDVPGCAGDEVTFDDTNFGATMYDELEIEQLNEHSGQGWSTPAVGMREDSSRRRSIDSFPPAESRGDFRPAADEQSREEVDCTVFAPPVACPDTTIMVQVFVHLPSLEEQAMTMASRADPSAAWRGSTSLGTELVQGSRLSFHLDFPRLRTSQPERSVVWRGKTASVQFSVDIPKSINSGDVHGTLFVTQESMPIGQITFIINISEEHPLSPESRPTGSATRFSRAFVSYARRDAIEVTRRVQLLEAVGIRYFQDVFSLRPGEEWMPKIYDAIERSDVLLLFWSHAAKDSKWVEKEWRYGLDVKGDGFIAPVVIEGPPIPQPPQELEHIHFGVATPTLARTTVFGSAVRWFRRRDGH